MLKLRLRYLSLSRRLAISLACEKNYTLKKIGIRDLVLQTNSNVLSLIKEKAW